AVAHALMDLFVGGVVGLADLAVTAGVTEEEGDHAAHPAPAHRFLFEPLQVGQLALVQHVGPVQRLEGDVYRLRVKALAQAADQRRGEGVLTLGTPRVLLMADAMNAGDCKLHPCAPFAPCVSGRRLCRRAPKLPLSTSSRNSSPRRWLSAIALRQ